MLFIGIENQIKHLPNKMAKLNHMNIININFMAGSDIFFTQRKHVIPHAQWSETTS